MFNNLSSSIQYLPDNVAQCSLMERKILDWCFIHYQLVHIAGANTEREPIALSTNGNDIR